MNEKLLTFEEWLGIFDALLDCDDTEAEEIFNAARQGLAGPPELVWRTGEGVGKGLHIAFVPTAGGYYAVKSFEGQYFWHSPEGHEIKCQSIEDGKAQAQEHFEKLWWEMSKPAIKK